MKRIAFAAPVLLLVACTPKLDDRLFLVDAPRILAVRAEPAEAAPGTTITYRALQVSPDGEISDAIDFAFCTERAPLASLGSVSVNCLAATGPAIMPFASTGDDAMGMIPMQACRLFGPDVPLPGQPGDPPGRPVDPDPTGGYYQPLRLIPTSDDNVSIERTRLRCGLAMGSGDDRVEFTHRYHANTNPMPSAIDVGDQTIDTSMPSQPVPVTAGATITIRAHWSECPSGVDDLTDAGCSGSEPYLVYDPVMEHLVERREAIRLAWFATGGVLESDRSGRESSDTATFSENAWTAPDVAGPATLWVILRDERGGVGWFRIDLVVST